MCHGRGYVIRGHKDCSQHHTSREEMENRAGKMFRVCQIQDSGEHDHGGKNSDRDVPANDFPDQHVSEPEQKSESGYFSQATPDITDNQVTRGEPTGGECVTDGLSAFNGLFHES